MSGEGSQHERTPHRDLELDALLEFVRDARGFDFRGYRRSTLGRRIHRRMRELGLERLVDYRDLLEVDVDEFTNLLNAVLINVTEFFRDPDAWGYLESEVVPLILSRRVGDQPIRLWSAGCSSGEEAYTLAMVMAERLGLDETVRRVKVYATDVDLEALAQARTGTYPKKALESVPEALRTRYFEPALRGGDFIVSPALRSVVVFGRHDLTSDPPISRIDLLACRNTLMYLNPETQALVVSRLHYALNDGGYLFLGRAEMIVYGGTGRFNPVSLPHRVFVALPGRSRVPASNSDARRPFDLAPLQVSPPPTPSPLREAAFEVGPIAQLVIEPDGKVLAANETVRDLLGIDPSALDRPLADLHITLDSVDLQIPVAATIEDRTARDLGVVVRAVGDGGTVELHVRISPLLSADSAFLGVSVTFVDVSKIAELRAAFDELHGSLEAAHQQLQSTNEELTTSNEELQSSNEELETTIEELRSSNEEIETTNEELRAASGAVERMNETLIELNNELNSRVALHRRLVDSYPAGVVVLNERLLVEEWNAGATELWGLRADEVLNQAFFGLTIGLPLAGLQASVRACWLGNASGETLDIDAVDRRGRQFTCRVSVVASVGATDDVKALLVMSDAQGEHV